MGQYTFDQLLNALGHVESTNDYSVIGPETRRGDRAYGRFQVMDFNVPSWSEQYYGTRLTPQEFLANQEAQDAVFRGRMGEYYGQSTGTPEERIRNAGSLWFTGQPYSAETATRSDGYIDNQEYGDRILRALGATPQGTETMAMTPDPEQQQPQGFFGRVGQGISGLFQGFQEAPETSQTDPFANLSRNQRMMLGFAALRDAAASLEGRDSSYFGDALGGFETARERERLRTQGQAQSLMNLQQALLLAVATEDEATANLYRDLIAQTRAAMGGTAVPQPAGGVALPVQPAGDVAPPVQPTGQPPTGQPMTTTDEISDLGRQIEEADAATAQLTQQAMTGGITGLDYGPMIEQSRLEADRLRQERAELVRLQEEAAQEVETESRVAPLVEQGLGFLVNEDGSINVLGARAVGAAPGLAGGDARLAAAAISELAAIAAMDSVSSARERGFGGTLTDADIALIQRSGGIFDINQPEATVATLRRIANSLSPEAQEAPFGGSGATSPSGSTFAPSDEDSTILERYR